MASRILRRSGTAVVEYLRYLEWVPKVVFAVGVGGKHQEIDVMREEWSDFYLYGFEPHPDIYASVNETFPGRLHRYAISDYTGRGMLHAKSSWKDGSSLIPKTQNSEDYKEIPVEVTTLDDMLCIMPSDAPGLLWLDCEGSELAALKGGEKFLVEKNIEVINIEQTARPRGDDWPTPYVVHCWLTEHGFYQAWTHTHRTVIGQFDSVYLRGDIFDPRHCSCLESIRTWMNQNLE